MKTLKLLVISVILGIGSNAIAADVNSLDYKSADRIANEVISLATQKGYNVSVTIVDINSNILITLRNNSAAPHTPKTSFKKAFTALTVKSSTSDILNSGPSGIEKFVVANLPNSDNIIILKGGLVIKRGSEIIGAIGVAGAPGGELDEGIAKTVLDNLGYYY